jgi:transcriptional regulator of acetoin/glycerol metabolism
MKIRHRLRPLVSGFGLYLSHPGTSPGSVIATAGGDLPEVYRGRARCRLLTPMERAERDAIVEVLRATGGNKKDAARRLGISRTTLYNAIRAFGIVAPVSRS